ncbi:hypothetical protein AAHE18_16G236500 [Arachis hypogaea]|nr:uncharacterized protein DS421_16g557720 [Arachis hypogaea]
MRLGINGPWITKSYLEMILDKKKGVPHHKKTHGFYVRVVTQKSLNAFLNADWSLIEKTRRLEEIHLCLEVKALQSLHQNQFVRLLTLLPDWRICLGHGLSPSTDQMAICSQNLY